jgi:lipid A 3-O-deacylase
MALVALWAPPARCADATAADATAARVPIYDRLFAEVEFGGALNDSEKGQPGWLGCPVTFRESGGLGFQITSNIDIVGSIEHVSHADLCGRTNPGLSSFGLRVGYKF